MAEKLLLGCVAAILLAGVGWRCGFFSSQNVRIVDFDDVISPSDLAGPEDDRPLLRVAVAAMISPAATSRYYDDLLRLVGDKVGRRVLFLQRKTYAEVNDLLEHRDIDLAFVCSGPYVTGHRRFGLEILAVPVVDGEKVYHCYFLANRNGPVESFDDLRGKRFAFTDPRSNTGCLVPKYFLAQRGYTADRFFGETFFTYSHDNSIMAVADGLADGAAVDQLIWDYMNTTDPTYTSRTRIIEKSPPFGIPPVVVHPDLDKDLKQRLRAAFLTLHRNEKSLAVLRRLQIDRFEEGDDAMYDTVRRMQRWLADNKGMK